MTAESPSPRWVGSGWTVFNNKGKPVRQFEPFFSDTHKPDFDIGIGVSPVLFYDPVERVVATLHPNHTYEKAVFDPWRQASHDVNDTVALDPRADPDIKAYVEKHFAGQPSWRTWLQQRIANPNHLPPDTGGADPERDAAVRAHQHAGTPTIAHFDALGRTFLTVADNGKDRNGDPQKYETRVVLDIEGNQREVTDAKGRVVMRYDYDLLGDRIHQASMEAGERWMLNDVTGKPIRAWDSRGHNFATEYDRLRRPTRQKVHGTDAKQSDPRTLNKNIVFAKTEYGEPEAGASQAEIDRAMRLNLRTRVFRQYDGAGVVTNMATNPVTGDDEAYDFKGNLLRSSRLVAPEYKEIINWDTAQPAGEPFSSSTAYDALNRPVSLEAPDKSVIRPTYSEANLLNALEANLRGAAEITRFVTNIDYNAKGQRVLIQYGNRAETRYRYDPHTFRLIGLYTRRGAQFDEDCENPDPPPPATIAAPEMPPPGKHCGLQNLSYTYDPAGNITHIRDSAQDTIYFRNRRVEPSNDYLYDAIYRLIEATGREHMGQAAAGAPAPKPASYNDWARCRLPHPGDGNAMGTYRESYTYDEVGNFREMAHRGTDPAHEGWTRTYTYNEPSLLDKGAESNRLTSTSFDSLTEVYSALVDGWHDGYDAHGNMLRMPQLQEMRWDFQDRLLMTQRQQVNDEDEDGVAHQGERTWYVYDASGQRVRKVTDRAAARNHAPARMKERIYVGGFEVYREYGGDGESIALERETLHVMDDRQRVALVETQTAEAGVFATLRSLITSPTPMIRYQFGNHLGTACFELDDQAQIISYEEYTPYGSTSYRGVPQHIEVPKRRYSYVGKERDDESGLINFGNRLFAPWFARWISPDSAGLVDGADLYWYCRANPVKFRDDGGARAATPQEATYISALRDLETHQAQRFQKLSSAGQIWDYFASGSGPTRQAAFLRAHRQGLAAAINRAAEGEKVMAVPQTPSTIDITTEGDTKLMELTRFTAYLTTSESKLVDSLRALDALRSNPVSAVAYTAGDVAGASDETKGNLALTGEAVWGLISVSPGVAQGLKQNRGLGTIRQGIKLQSKLEGELFAGKHPLKMRDANVSVGIGWDASGKPTMLVSVNKGAPKEVINQLRQQANSEGWVFVEPNVGHAEVNLQANTSFVRMDIFSTNYNCSGCVSAAGANVTLHDTKPYPGFAARGDPNSPVPANSSPSVDLLPPRPMEPLNTFYGYGR